MIAEMSYTHTVYTAQARRAQRRLAKLNSAQVAFAGAYHGWGFHEDGCRAGVAAARHFGVEW
jgi:predicted NAD/FAD-binding protein